MIFRVEKIISDIQRLTSNNLASDEMALEGTALDGIIRIKVVLKKPFLVAKSVTDFFFIEVPPWIPRVYTSHMS